MFVQSTSNPIISRDLICAVIIVRFLYSVSFLAGFSFKSSKPPSGPYQHVWHVRDTIRT